MAEPHTEVFLGAGAVLFALGFFGLAAAAIPIRRVVAANVMACGVFLVLVAMAARAGSEGPDPVPHAMVLTGIVVSVCATGLALVLSEREREVRRTQAGKGATGGPGPPEDLGDASAR